MSPHQHIGPASLVADAYSKCASAVAILDLGDDPAAALDYLTQARADLDRAITLLTPEPVTLREWPKTVPEGRWAWYIMPDDPAVIIGFFRLDAGDVVFINEEDGADFDRKMHHEGEYFRRIEETPRQT